MIIRDVESSGQIPISFQTGTLLIALERGLSPRWLSYVGSGVAANLFLLALAVTRDDVFERTCFVFLTGRRGVARLLTRMPTHLLRLGTFLLAVLVCIFTLSRLMTGLSAAVRTTLEGFAADQSTRNVGSPTRLILQRLLPT